MAERSRARIDDESPARATTGHEWDGIKELEQAAAALVAVDLLRHDRLGACLRRSLYPAWPLLNRRHAGVLGYSSRGEVEERDRRAPRPRRPATLERDRDACRSRRSRRSPSSTQLRRRRRPRGLSGQLRPVPRLGRGRLAGLSQPQRRRLAVGRRRSTEIHQTIAHGIRYRDRRRHARCREMPAFGATILTRRRSTPSRNYVLHALRQRSTTRRSPRRGKHVFADNCAACHGDDGKGNRELGAPDLTDAIWLYGGDASDIVAQIASAAARRDAGVGGRLERHDDQGARRSTSIRSAAAKRAGRRAVDGATARCRALTFCFG